MCLRMSIVMIFGMEQKEKNKGSDNRKSIKQEDNYTTNNKQQNNKKESCQQFQKRLWKYICFESSY